MAGIERTLTLANEEGLHARPAGVLAKLASQFRSEIMICSKGVTKNAKSIMSILSLGLEKGSEITLMARGEDEALAIEALVKLINNRFEQ